MVLCLGEPPRRFLWCWLSFLIFISLLYLHFIFDLHFVVVLHLSFFFIHIFFSTSSLTFLWTIAGFLHSFYTFSPAHRRVIPVHFQPLSYLLATVLSGRFLPTDVFYLRHLHRYFNLPLSRPPWEPAVLPWGLQGFILILETQARPICLFNSQ